MALLQSTAGKVDFQRRGLAADLHEIGRQRRPAGARVEGVAELIAVRVDEPARGRAALVRAVRRSVVARLAAAGLRDAVTALSL